MPPLEGVTVQIFGKDKESPIHTLITDKDGVYSVGPLDGKIEYRYVNSQTDVSSQIQIIKRYLKDKA